MNNQFDFNTSVNSIINNLESFHSVSANKSSKIDYNADKEIFNSSVRSYTEAVFGDWTDTFVRGLDSLTQNVRVLKENFPKNPTISEVESIKESVKKIKQLFPFILNVDLYPYSRSDKAMIQSKIDELKDAFFSSMVTVNYELQNYQPPVSSAYQAFEIVVDLQALLDNENKEISSLFKALDNLSAKLVVLDIFKNQKLSDLGEKIFHNLMVKIENLIPNLYDLDLDGYSETDRISIEEKIESVIDAFLIVKEGLQVPSSNLAKSSLHPKPLTPEQEKLIDFKNKRREANINFSKKFIESLHDEQWKKELTKLLLKQV